MFRFKYVAAIILGTIILGCASEKPQLSVKTSAKKNIATLGQTVKLSLSIQMVQVSMLLIINQKEKKLPKV